MVHWHRRELDDYFSLYRHDAVLHHTLVEGDLVAMTFTLTGTAQGQPINRSGLALLQFDGLQCIERWTSTH